MSVLFLTIGTSLMIAVGFLFVFIVSAKSGQFDDSYTPGVRVLFDDEKTKTTDIDSAEKTK
jgi:cbb3-type cytochrome oxidase maturation protein